MVDMTAVGRSAEAFVVDVERGKISEFARSVGSSHPAYVAGENPTSPPTFLTVQRLWQDTAADAWRFAALDPARVLHAEQEFVFSGPPPKAGTRLTAQATITEIYEKQGSNGPLTFVVMVTEFKNEAGEFVASLKLTGVETAPREQEQE